MAFDLALAHNGDLILSAARDLQGATGTAIIEQRIEIRLRLARGTWIYDPSGRLGSNLSELFGISPEVAAIRAVPLVREALRTMSEIEISDVVVEPGEKDITVVVYYRLIYTDEVSGVSDTSEIESTGVTIQLGG